MLSISALEDFKSSKQWQAVTKELYNWLDEIHGELEDSQCINEEKTFHRLAGNAETVRRCINIVDFLIVKHSTEEENINE